MAYSCIYKNDTEYLRCWRGRKMRRETIRCLKETAAKCRLNVVRMLRASGHGHIGGTYSSIDMVTALYFYKMNVNPEKPDWEDRDRFLLSAGHKSMVQYAVLAEKGYFQKKFWIHTDIYILSWQDIRICISFQE